MPSSKGQRDFLMIPVRSSRSPDKPGCRGPVLFMRTWLSAGVLYSTRAVGTSR
jgi:hypothetical protein